MIYNGLDIKFRRDIYRLKNITILYKFLIDLDKFKYN